MNPDARPLTLLMMLSGRSLGLLCLALSIFLGLAGGTDHPPPVSPPLALSSIRAPWESLPTPLHDEATCAFCQAAIFPPCAPQPVAVSVGDQGGMDRERPAPDARAPHAAAQRPASSRAPPALRSV